MSENDLCEPSLCTRNGRRHLGDVLSPFVNRLNKIIKSLVGERIWSKLPQGRKEKREWLERQPALFLKGGREERQSNPDWSRDENPIQYEEPAPMGEPRRIVSRDNRVWTVTQGERLMTK